MSTLDALADLGEHDEVLEVAAEMAPAFEASGDVLDLIAVRSVQARIFALRGQGPSVPKILDWLERAARGTGDPQLIASGLGSAAVVRARLGQNEAAATLLTELASYPDARNSMHYHVLLLPMVRTALGIGEPALAERLVSGLESRYAYAEHALVAANGILTEARGNLQVAGDVYAGAADRWERFGVVPEQAFALLGQGRCLLGLSRPTEARPVLQQARKIFELLQSGPALVEIDALLATAA